MYQRVLKIFMATRDRQLETLLRGVPPLERFSHEFIISPDIAAADIKGCGVIVLDFGTVGPECLAGIRDAMDGQTLVAGCFDAGSFPVLAEWHHLFDQVWTRPFDADRVQASFSGMLRRLREREDALLTGKYLDTLIDNLPDLIWFKDARGSHLKVNRSFCRTVNKTREQVEGRGHYYIWDIEPDEYAQGEYICLESEEIVLEKKETCLFDETVKCGGELRKFKTYKSPIFDIDGAVIGTVGFAHDVTDLQNLVIELNILIESLPFAIMVTGRDGIITSVNRKFTDIFSRDKAELIGKSVDSFLDDTQLYTRSRRWTIEQDDGSTYLLSENKILKLHDENLLDIFGVQAGHIYLFEDSTLEYHHRNKLLLDANTDHLTKLNNRRSLQDFMRKTQPQPDMVLLLADLDNFKEVNDRYGHDEGDRVLVAFASLLQRIFPVENLFRLGGDEFAIVLHNVDDAVIPRRFAERLLAGFEENVARQFPHTDISVSIGIAMDDEKEGNFGELFKKADMALYESKKAGKNVFSFWKR